MSPMTFEYQINMREYHNAVYFGFVNRYRTMLQIFLVVAAVALLCACLLYTSLEIFLRDTGAGI